MSKEITEKILNDLKSTSSDDYRKLHKQAKCRSKNMNIEFVEVCTIKELKQQSLYHLKQSKKLDRKFHAEFSRQEKHRAETCKEGTATIRLGKFAFDYFSSVCEENQNYEHLSTLRPSTEVLIWNTEFNTDNPFYNKYFASWWYKKNWKLLVKLYMVTK